MLCASIVLYSKYQQKYPRNNDRSTEEVPVGTEKVRTLFLGAYRTHKKRVCILTTVTVAAHKVVVVVMVNAAKLAALPELASGFTVRVKKKCP